MINPIQEMLILQQKLNIKTNGKHWKIGQTKEARLINWNRCIYMEAIEAMDSFNWKHWKDINAADDWDNLWVELIDIWHFLMSEMLRLDQTDVPAQKPPMQDKEILMLTIEKLTKLAISASIEQNNDGKYLKQMLPVFFDCLSFSGLDIEQLYQRYVVKNQLNIFRQNHGYKEGNYHKIWQGKEDNVVAFELMVEKSLTPDELYQALELIYAKVSL